eukprot:4911924-Prymnesium_polylepis.1
MCASSVRLNPAAQCLSATLSSLSHGRRSGRKRKMEDGTHKFHQLSLYSYRGVPPWECKQDSNADRREPSRLSA